MGEINCLYFLVDYEITLFYILVSSSEEPPSSKRVRTFQAESFHDGAPTAGPSSTSGLDTEHGE